MDAAHAAWWPSPWRRCSLRGSRSSSVCPPGALLGSMVVSIAASLTLSVHAPESRRGLLVAQSVLGGALCSSFSPEAWGALADNWAVSLGAVVGVVAVAQGVALVCAKLGHLDPRTATLGLMPGGASAMVALSDELGADARLVTLFQYVRLCVVILVAVVVGRWAGDTPDVAVARAADLPGSPPPLWAWLTTAAVSAVGSVLGLRLRLPAGAFLGPVLCGGAAHGGGGSGGRVATRGTALLHVGARCARGQPVRCRGGAAMRSASPVALAASVAMVVGCCCWRGLVRRRGRGPAHHLLRDVSRRRRHRARHCAWGRVRALSARCLAVQVGRLLLIFLVAPTFLRRLSPSRGA